jgi:hypothetical protein
MSMSLVEALQQVNLEVGKTYRCEVREHLVEVRVLERQAEPGGIPESDIMLDAWVVLPRPAAIASGESTLGKPRPPTIPDIPAEEEA